MTSSSRILQHEREEQQSSSQEVSSDVIKVTHDDKKMKGKGLTEYKCVSDVVDEGMDVDREGGLGGDNSVPSNHRLQGEETIRFVGKLCGLRSVNSKSFILGSDFDSFSEEKMDYPNMKL